MLSFNRRTLILMLAALGACGFQPAYGPNGAATNLQANIEIDAPTTRDGFNFVRHLEERLGQPETAQFTLSYALKLNEDDLGITPAQSITRYNVLGAVDYAVHAVGNGAVVHSGTVDAFTSYSATGTTVSTQTAKRAAYARLMIILADQITTRLIATSGGWAQ
ncbi:LPS assembly lipoprotein LptE [Profundibacter sp.]